MTKHIQEELTVYPPNMEDAVKNDMTGLTGLTVWGETVKKVKTVRTKKCTWYS